MSGFKRQMAKWAEYDIQHHASLLKWTTLIIWACSLAAEVGTFAANKKLPHKEKSFIIKQELSAGGISLAIMYLLADRFEKAGSWLVKQARVLPRELPETLRTPVAVQKILNNDAVFIKNELKGNTKLAEKLIGFEKGMRVSTGTLGTILAFNITTPLISNKIASYMHNKELLQKARQPVSNFTAPKPNPLPAPVRPVVYPAGYPNPLYNRYNPYQQAFSPYR